MEQNPNMIVYMPGYEEAAEQYLSKLPKSTPDSAPVAMPATPGTAVPPPNPTTTTP